MASIGRPAHWEELVDQYIDHKRDHGLKEQTLKDYRRVILRCLRMLADVGWRSNVRRIGREQVNYLVTQFPPHGANYRNLQFHLDVLKPFLDLNGNPILTRMNLKFPSVRTKAHWLTLGQMNIIREAIEHDIELLMLFHLEGSQGLRRCEVMRLTVEDFTDTHINVLGKGAGLGKPRELDYHPETRAILEEFLVDHREPIISVAKRRNPAVEVPNGLFLWTRGERLGVCQRTALDRMVERMVELSGIHFSHHTLRRTWGKELSKSGTRLEVISEMMGHRDTATTIKYLGLNLGDQRNALAALYERQKSSRASKVTKSLIPEKLHQTELTGR